MSQSQNLNERDKRDIFLIECVEKHVCLYERKKCTAEERSKAWSNVVFSVIEAGYYSHLSGE